MLEYIANTKEIIRVKTVLDKVISLFDNTLLTFLLHTCVGRVHLLHRETTVAVYMFIPCSISEKTSRLKFSCQVVSG